LERTAGAHPGQYPQITRINLTNDAPRRPQFHSHWQQEQVQPPFRPGPKGL
jgi:hypothetical protein